MTAQKANERSIVLTDGVTQALVFNKRMQQEFPFIRHIANTWSTVQHEARRGCNGCRKRKPRRKHREGLLQKARQEILNLPTSRKQLVKDVLGASTVVVQMPTSNSDVRRLTF
jgi:hypothetical protein